MEENLKQSIDDIRKTGIWTSFIPSLVLVYVISKFFGFGFWETFIFLALVYLSYKIFHIIITQLIYSIFLKNKMARYYYYLLMKKFNFPNPADYYTDSPEMFFAGLAENEDIEREVAVMSSSLLTELMSLRNQGSLIALLRLNKSMRLAIERYMNDFK